MRQRDTGSAQDHPKVPALGRDRGRDRGHEPTHSDPAPMPKLFPVEPLPTTKDECFTQYEQVLLGFQVTNQLTVKVRDLDTVGDVIDRATDTGGNLTRFQSVNFTIEDTKGLRQRARAEAVKDLMAKAAQVAALGGSGVGPTDLHHRIGWTGIGVLQQLPGSDGLRRISIHTDTHRRDDRVRKRPGGIRDTGFESLRPNTRPNTR